MGRAPESPAGRGTGRRLLLLALPAGLLEQLSMLLLPHRFAALLDDRWQTASFPVRQGPRESSPFRIGCAGRPGALAGPLPSEPTPASAPSAPPPPARSAGGALPRASTRDSRAPCTRPLRRPAPPGCGPASRTRTAPGGRA